MSNNQQTLSESIYNVIVLKLKSKSIKLTDIRKRIINLIINNDHLNMQQIIEKLNSQQENVNIMSVYNTIDLLLQHHIIMSNTFDGKNIWYEISSNKTIHIKCDICGDVKHVSYEKEKAFNLSEILKLIDDQNVKLEHVKIEAHITCEKCNKQ